MFTFPFLFWVTRTFIFERMSERWRRSATMDWASSVLRFDAISWDRAQMAIKLSNHRFIYITMEAVLTVSFSLYSIRNECQYWAKEWQERTSLSVWIREERLTNPSSGSSAVSFLWLQMESIWVGHMYQGTACRISQRQKWEQNTVGRTAGTLWKSFCNIVQATHVETKTAGHFFPSVGRVY